MKMLAAFIFITIIFFSCTGDSSTEQSPETNTTSNNVAAQNGKQIFFVRCASCHMINKELTGPALRGVESRWPDKQKLYAFIRNSEAVIKSDKYAHDLWLKFNQTMMNKHPDLTDKQISDLLAYINSVSEPVNP